MTPCAICFEFDSDTLRSGTGEIRSWIVVAGACSGAGRRSSIISRRITQSRDWGLRIGHASNVRSSEQPAWIAASGRVAAVGFDGW